MLTKEQIKKIEQIKGKARGAIFNTDVNYIKNIKNEKETEKVLKKLKKIEPDFNYKNIKNTDWVPLRWRILLLLIIKDHFNWKSKDIYKMGHAAPCNSFVVKIILSYFNLFKKTCEQAPIYWKKHYSVGDLETFEYKDKEKYVIFRLKKMNIDPIFCIYLKGYFKGMADLTNRSEHISIEESKCMFEGDPYHEYIIKW